LLTWIAVRSFAVPLGVAAPTVLAFGLAAPLTSYGTQVYPELPAALAVAVAIAGLTHPKPNAWAIGLPVMVLPWLGIKYGLVAAALAALGVWVLARRDAVRLVAGLAVAGVAYLVGHRLLYGGWTVYAAGDHFVDGELTVVGNDPNYLGRSRRLLGLLLDREFGLAVWMPGYLLMVPALALLARRRPPGWVILVAPLVAGWATATWVALTMHGWWWPGRQTVVVLPCVVLAVAWWAAQLRPAAVRLVAATGVVGAFSWTWLVIEARTDRRTLVVDFMATDNPIYRALHAVFPDYAHPTTRDWLLQAAWVAALAIAALPAFSLGREDNPTRRPTHVPA
jgi:hypothetical protein